jgi:hypothetical protein
MLMGDDADVEATVVGILREPVGRTAPREPSDPFDLTSQVPLPSGPAEPARWNSLETTASPPPEPVRNGASPAFIGFMAALGLVLLGAVGWVVFGGGGAPSSDAVPSEAPPAATAVPAAEAPAPAAAAPAASTPAASPAPAAGSTPAASAPGAPVRNEAARPAPSAPTVAPSAVPAPSAPTPAAPEFFKVEFRNASSTVTGLTVACKDNVTGAGASVSLASVPRGPCSVTGSTGGGVPLKAFVTVTADRAYTCFANDSRACQ